jgi:hypothetical protein
VTAQDAETVRHRVACPQGYQWSFDTNSPLPFFDREGRKVVLLCHDDGSVTWQLIGKNGEVLGPLDFDGSSDG